MVRAVLQDPVLRVVLLVLGNQQCQVVQVDLCFLVVHVVQRDLALRVDLCHLFLRVSHRVRVILASQSNHRPHGVLGGLILQVNQMDLVLLEIQEDQFFPPILEDQEDQRDLVRLSVLGDRPLQGIQEVLRDQVVLAPRNQLSHPVNRRDQILQAPLSVLGSQVLLAHQSLHEHLGILVAPVILVLL